MSNYIVFVRFFPDIRGAFPFERFACLPDNEIAAELEKIRLEELTNGTTQLERKRRRRSQKQAIADWANAGGLGIDWQRKALRECTTESSMSEFADRIFSRYPLAMFHTKELAEAVRTALQERVAELKRAALDTTPFQGKAVFFEMANPWFSVIAVSDLAPSQMLLARTQIDRLNQPNTKPSSKEEAFVRSYMTELKPILNAAGSDEPIQSALSASLSLPTNADQKPAGSDEPIQSALSASSVLPANAVPAGEKTKRSHARGEARTKLISALLAHHEYSDGGCMNWEPIGNNQLARAAGGVSPSSAKAFFDKHFNGHGHYIALCRRDPQRVLSVFKALNGDFAVDDLYGDVPPNDRKRTDE